MKAKFRNRCMSPLCLLERECRQATTAWLSQWHTTWWFRHAQPQRIPANRMGSSSLTVMGSAAVVESHWTWNHLSPDHAPQPHWPDASEVTWCTGSWRGTGRNDTPFQVDANDLHHAKSAQNSVLRRIGGPLPAEL